LQEGRCRPPAAVVAGLGEACSFDDDAVNPCGGGAFCLPVDDEGGGLCVKGCDADPGSCPSGSACAFPYVGVGSASVCLPACDLDAPVCGEGAVCVASREAVGCDPQRAACARVGCDQNGACGHTCASNGDCDGGTFCVERVFDNCRAQAGDQVVSICSPPAADGQPCDLLEPGSCIQADACVPQRGPNVALCAEESNTPLGEGAACDAGGSVNPCERGAYCARGDDGQNGRCMRFCDDDVDCGANECVDGHVFAGDGNPDNAFDDVRVCTFACDADAECGGFGFFCDRDPGDPCDGPGHCLPPEGRSGAFCSTDAECPTFDGPTVCSQGRCVDPADACDP
jgi:hypothetical protein